VGRVYDHDLQEVEELGWEEFIARQWDSIFVGYRSWSGMRTMARRWSDLIEAGLGCSQEIADQLVQAEIIGGRDRGLEGADAAAVVSGMVTVLDDVRADLAGMSAQDPGTVAKLLDQHAKLLAFLRSYALGEDDGEASGTSGQAGQRQDEDR
jgi:hypothetical protein